MQQAASDENSINKVKVKVHSSTGHEGDKVQLYYVFHLGTRWVCVVNATP
jgi:hypothetical protein